MHTDYINNGGSMKFLLQITKESKTTKFTKLNFLALCFLLISFSLYPLTSFTESLVNSPLRGSVILARTVFNLVRVAVSIIFLALTLLISVKGIGLGLGNRNLYTFTIIGGMIALFYLLGLLLINFYFLSTIPSI